MKIALILSFFAVSIAVGAVEVEDVTFGFGNGYKTGTWAPLTITVRNQDEPTGFRGELIVEVRNFSADTAIERYATPLRLIRSELQRKHFYVYCPKNATQLVIQLAPVTPATAAEFRGVATRHLKDILLPTPIARKDYFVLALAPSGDKLSRVVDKKQLAGSDAAQVHVRYLPTPMALPHDWIGYSAVDALVVREIRLTDRRILKTQQTAMLDWIQRGGTLIVSGGSSFNYLQGSFIVPFLPVELKGIEKTEPLPAALLEQLNGTAVSKAAGVTTTSPSATDSQSPLTDSHFENIQFAPKAGCEVLLGTADQIYIAKRKFGDGQILCLAFDYNALPFRRNPKNMEKSEPRIAETFWHGLLSRHGKSPKHFADRYALTLQHETQIHKHFLSEMPTRIPLIKLLAVVLPLYLLVFGSFLLYFGKSKQKSRTYWIGGCLFVLIPVIAIASARKVWFPNTVTANRLSILSVYPERQRAHLLSYVSLRAAARTETSIDFTTRTFVRHQDVEESTGGFLEKIGTLVQDSQVQLRGVSVEPWHPTTYVEEKFLALAGSAEGTVPLPNILENTWRVVETEMGYLGKIALRSGPIPSTVGLRLQVTSKMPPDAALAGARKIFARILQRDYVLRYLAAEANLNSFPYFIGWIPEDFTGAIADQGIDTNEETLVIFRPGAGH